MLRSRGIATILMTALLLGAVATRSHAIPAFARKYRVTCSVCHTTVPSLNDFGERFASNGFEFMPGETPQDTIATGDELLRLLERINFAFRVDSYVNSRSARRAGGPSVDMQFPYGIKLLTGGPIANRVSYYMYFFMSERGEVAGLEDAYLQFTDIGGSGVSVMVGQFQASDPLMKRELRLEYEDYQPYRVRVGEVNTDLTYDRGVMASYSPRSGTDLTIMLLNGEGLTPSDERRNFDRDSGKSFGVRLSQDVGPLRAGLFGYYGSSSRDGEDNRLLIFGPDATLPLGDNGELNLQYLRRLDDNPFFLDTGAEETTVDAGLAEIVYWPRGRTGRWALTGLYNYVSSDDAVISLRLGEQLDEPGYLDRYHTAAVAANYLLQRNIRLLVETGWDFEVESARLTAGFMAAF
ncbi:MAG TPA: hypothetical protein VF167_04675 [Longimicrobiaceae bacterium]